MVMEEDISEDVGGLKNLVDVRRLNKEKETELARMLEEERKRQGEMQNQQDQLQQQTVVLQRERTYGEREGSSVTPEAATNTGRDAEQARSATITNSGPAEGERMHGGREGGAGMTKAATSTDTFMAAEAPPILIRQYTSSCRKRKRKDGGANREQKQFLCPLEGCTGRVRVTNLKRHFSQVHKDFPKHEVRSLLKKTRKRPERRLRMWTCPENGCQWSGDRLDKHLASKIHGFDKACAKNPAKDARLQQPVTSGIPRRLSATNINCDSLADSFLKWLSSIEGGSYVPEFLQPHKRKERFEQNQRVANMVKTILVYAFGSGDFDPSRLGELVSLGTGSPSVIEQLSVGRTWSTVRNYLHAYSHFLQFLQTSRPCIVDLTTVSALKATLTGCIHTVSRISQEEMQRRKIRDRKDIIRWSDICNCIDSDMASDYMSKFKSATDDLDKKELAGKIEQHFLLQIALQNGKRTGIYADMSVAEFEAVEKRSDGFVVLIAEGKTFKVSCASGIFLSNSEYSLLQEYIDNCRCLFQPQTDQVFCRFSGERSSVRDIQKFLKMAWQEFGQKTGTDVGTISCSLIRKTLVSRSRQVGVERSVQEEMARHMDHTVSTADRHYDVNTGTRITAKFRQIISMFHDSLSEESVSHESDDDISSCTEVTPVSLVLMPENADCEIHESVLPKDKYCSKSKSKLSSSSRAQWFGRECLFTKNDAVRLRRCCATVIEKARKKELKVTKAVIIESVKTADPNFCDLLDKYTGDQIATKVRTEIRKRS